MPPETFYLVAIDRAVNRIKNLYGTTAAGSSIAEGTLYGTTYCNGHYTAGTVFQVDTFQWKLDLLITSRVHQRRRWRPFRTAL